MRKAQDFVQYPSESNTNKQYSTSTEFSTEKNSTIFIRITGYKKIDLGCVDPGLHTLNLFFFTR